MFLTSSCVSLYIKLEWFVEFTNILYLFIRKKKNVLDKNKNGMRKRVNNINMEYFF